jgi:hypothetical protein
VSGFCEHSNKPLASIKVETEAPSISQEEPCVMKLITYVTSRCCAYFLAFFHACQEITAASEQWRCCSLMMLLCGQLFLAESCNNVVTCYSYVMLSGPNNCTKTEIHIFCICSRNKLCHSSGS